MIDLMSVRSDRIVKAEPSSERCSFNPLKNLRITAKPLKEVRFDFEYADQAKHIFGERRCFIVKSDSFHGGSRRNQSRWKLS